MEKMTLESYFNVTLSSFEEKEIVIMDRYPLTTNYFSDAIGNKLEFLSWQKWNKNELGEIANRNGLVRKRGTFFVENLKLIKLYALILIPNSVNFMNLGSLMSV